MSTPELAGRVALVTGSSSGIGEATARALARLGASVVVNSSSSVEAGERVAASLSEESPAGSTARHRYVQADISDRAQVTDMVDTVVDDLGGLDILVNNAGWTTVVPHGDIEELTDEIFLKTFEVNVFGTWWLTKAALPALHRSQDGCVVTVTSVAGVRPMGSSIAYSMAKAALNQMTELLAKSHGPVRFNAVAPGLVATPWTADWDSLHERVAASAPLGRSGSPEDCAEAVLALVRMSYATGHVLVVDGGTTLIS